MQRMQKNEATADLRLMYFPLVVDVDDLATPEEGEADGQPEYSLDGGATWTATDGKLVGGTDGAYSVQLTQAETNLAAAGQVMLGRYKSAATAEARAIPIQFELDPWAPLTAASLLATALTGGDYTVEQALRLILQRAAGYMEEEQGEGRIYAGADNSSLLKTLTYEESAGVLRRTPS